MIKKCVCGFGYDDEILKITKIDKKKEKKLRI